MTRISLQFWRHIIWLFLCRGGTTIRFIPQFNCSKLEYDDSQLTTSLVTICQSTRLVNLIMQSHLLVRPDPLSLPLPEGYQLELQSNKPIIRYCWLVRMDRGNKVWKCKLCNKEFTGSNIVVATHYWPKLSTVMLEMLSSFTSSSPGTTRSCME